MELKPGIGFESLRFGEPSSAAKNLFGEPDEAETLEGMDDGGDCVVWHYWDKGFSLFFEAEKNSLFTSVEIDNPEATLWGERIFQMSEEKLIAFFKSKGFSDIETENHEWGEKRISFDDALIDFYFEKGKMKSVNFGIILGDDDVLILPN